MQEYLDKIGYGNNDTSGGLDRFWLASSLKISTEEQVDFLKRLYRGQLPFDKETTDKVKNLILLEKDNNREFSGKTGSASKNGKWIYGWFVGHLKKGDKEYVFATRVVGDGCYGKKAKEITEKILMKLKY
jgi:beta-lactamase class D